jgi:hypothetical protein
MPISIHLDHLHNVFIAAGTLACAVVIVIITVRYALIGSTNAYIVSTYKKSVITNGNTHPIIFPVAKL